MQNALQQVSEIGLEEIVTITEFADEYPKLGTYETWRYRVKNRHENGLAKCGALVKKENRWWIIKPNLKIWWIDYTA